MEGYILLWIDKAWVRGVRWKNNETNDKNDLKNDDNNDDRVGWDEFSLNP